jgi:hypothetical protein
MRQYLRNDPHSVCLRNQTKDVSGAHQFVCHNDGSECQDGCDKAALGNELAALEKAYEEKD